MIELMIKAYRYDELAPEVREKLFDKQYNPGRRRLTQSRLRDVISLWTQKLNRQGFEDAHIFYTGRLSQALAVAEVRYTSEINITPMIEAYSGHVPKDTYRALLGLAEAGGMHYSIQEVRGGCGSRCVRLSMPPANREVWQLVEEFGDWVEKVTQQNCHDILEELSTAYNNQQLRHRYKCTHRLRKRWYTAEGNQIPFRLITKLKETQK